VDCGIFLLIFAIHYLAGEDIPSAVDTSLWRRAFASVWTTVPHVSSQADKGIELASLADAKAAFKRCEVRAARALQARNAISISSRMLSEFPTSIDSTKRSITVKSSEPTAIELFCHQLERQTEAVHKLEEQSPTAFLADVQQEFWTIRTALETMKSKAIAAQRHEELATKYELKRLEQAHEDVGKILSFLRVESAAQNDIAIRYKQKQQALEESLAAAEAAFRNALG